MKKSLKGIFTILIVAILIFGTSVVIQMAIENRKRALDTNRTQLTKKTDLLAGYIDSSSDLTERADEYRLPVPLFNQMDEPSLKYGCEATALSMLLNYYHFDYTKNDVQAKIKKEDYLDENGLFGDPDIGFVGDVTGKNPGTGVNVGPIFHLTQDLIESPYKVVNSSGTDVEDLLKIVESGNPVWVIVTIDYKVPTKEDLIEWPTRNGEKTFSLKHHAAVLTGFDEENVFLNDPYGKEVVVKKIVFEELYQKMGQQSLYIN